MNDLVEKQITPRYIDTLLVEQGSIISDLVMSKKQGGHLCLWIAWRLRLGHDGHPKSHLHVPNRHNGQCRPDSKQGGSEP